MSILEDSKVEKLARIVEESTRSTKEGVKYFIEPAPGTLARAKNKRHHIIFGRRGSGKSSLLAKVTADLTLSRSPIAYVDLEEFKGHSYPDVLLSVLIKILGEFKLWMDTAAIHPANRTTFWRRLFGSVPTKKSLSRAKTAGISAELGSMVHELNQTLFAADETKIQTTNASETSTELQTALTASLKTPVSGTESSAKLSDKEGRSLRTQQEYTSRKVEILHRNIMRYKSLFQKMIDLAEGPVFVLLDDLYHIRKNDQANVLDYIHRIAKGLNFWVKVGTIRHRSRWYAYGDPPTGMKLGDDAEEIDLDVTLEKYDLTKRFLLRILEQFARESGLKLDDVLTDGARDRLVLASGGVARDFLTIFRRAIDVAKERLARADDFRGERIGAEDVNKAAGEFDKFKREDFSRDAGEEEQRKLLELFEKVSEFCLTDAKANCFLVDKDYSGEDVESIPDLVDLKFLHHVRSRVTVRDRANRLYDAYMLDLSQYTGERARRNFDIVEFWGKDADDSLRKSKFIFAERPRI
ncbi:MULTISPECIES: P-loop NTPase fold protein [unclassified Bradyrhizobium]|uniref:P-loop NTPase fold protein n=1 Tax=unclassified Bradyrhizobium TaxID=2631580 RepID=UPI0028EC639C|nr:MULTISPECIES: P-loop NTPase fold protein [unclassified Bradyrhizobium]